MGRIEIARIKQRELGGILGGLMAWVGMLVIVALIVIETSAVKLAAWGAIWTGWNVLALIAVALGRGSTYVVTREDSGDEGPTAR